VDTEGAPARGWAWPVIGLGVLLVAAAGSGAGGETDGLVGVRALARSGAQTAAGLLSITIGIAAKLPEPISETLRVGRSRPRVAIHDVVALALGLLALSAILDAALQASGLRAGSRLVEIDRSLTRMHDLDWPISFAGIALAPAIAEELFFRGVVLGSLLRYTRASIAVVVSALAFGLAHFDPAQSTATAILGLYLGSLAVATGSVRIGMGAHFLNNLAAITAPWVAAVLSGRPLLSLTFTAALAVGLARSVWLLFVRLRVTPGAGPRATGPPSRPRRVSSSDSPRV